MRRIGLCVLVFLAAFTLTASSQEQGAGTPQQKKIIKKVPMKQTAASSGEEMYREYCAVCHGKAGKGDGPAASEFKVPPPDLTTLAKNNNGKFPSDRVAAVLRLGTPARPWHQRHAGLGKVAGNIVPFMEQNQPRFNCEFTI
jgi:mono/diheme cytochrome c family protein